MAIAKHMNSAVESTDLACLECGTTMVGWSDGFCRGCGIPLSTQLRTAAARYRLLQVLQSIHQQKGVVKSTAMKWIEGIGITVALLGILLLVAGIVLWFSGPGWFRDVALYKMRATSIFLMAGGPLVSICAVGLGMTPDEVGTAVVFGRPIRRVRLEDLGLVLFFGGLCVLGGGIGLWFIVPQSFDYSESYALRTVSIAVMILGTIMLLTGFLIFGILDDENNSLGNAN